jgi:hypothetical protein
MRLFGSSLVAFVLMSALSCPRAFSADLRTTDFKNFSFPWAHPKGWPDHLQWMSLRLKQHIELVNGKWDERDASERMTNPQFSGLTLEEVRFAKLSGNVSEDVIVVLRYDSGGTQYHYWVYIYGEVNGAPKLLAYFHAGDRAQYGLYQVYEKDQTLNVRLFDPKLQEGDCCSSGYLNYRFTWNGVGFAAVGTPAQGHTDSSSRRPVSVFGLPQ